MRGPPCRDGMRGPPGPPGTQGEKGSTGPKSGGATTSGGGRAHVLHHQRKYTLV